MKILNKTVLLFLLSSISGAYVSAIDIVDETVENQSFVVSATRSGGVYDKDSGITSITGSTYTNNSITTSAKGGIEGAVIFVGSDLASITDTTFTGNYVSSDQGQAMGGAIDATAASGLVIDADFYVNYALSGDTAHGGAIYMDSYGSIASIQGTFDGNYVDASDSVNSYGGSASGGAIYVNTYSEIGSIGGLEADSPEGDLENGYAVTAVFSNNAVKMSEIAAIFEGDAMYRGGGAIFNYSYISTITANFIGNSVLNENGGYEATGGAISSRGGIDTISYSLFKGNTALVDTSDLSDGRASYAAGGAIYYLGYSWSADWKDLYTYYVDIISCSFQDNIAGDSTTIGYGGAIYSGYVFGSISNSLFSGNYANTYGGAIFNEGSMGSIEGVTFSNNTAGTAGGAIFNWGGLGTISDSVFESNTAGSYGGAITFETDGLLSIIDSTFNNNTAVNESGEATQGGAIYLQGSWPSYGENGAQLEYTLSEGLSYQFTGNDATYGGFLYLGGSDATNLDYDGAIATFIINDNAALILGEDGAYGTADSIYSEKGSTFNKEGSGSMIVNAEYVNKGNLAVKEGLMVLAGGVVEEVGYWFTNALTAAGIDLSSYKASLFVASSLSVGESVTVGTPSSELLADENGTATFASDSLAVMHSDGVSAQVAYSAEDGDTGAMLIGNGLSQAVVEDGATLVVYGVSSNTDIRVLEGFNQSISQLYGTDDATAAGATGWQGDNIIVANPLYTFDYAEWRTEEDGSSSYYLTLAVDDAGVDEVGQLGALGGVAANMGLIVGMAKDTTMARFALNTSTYLEKPPVGYAFWAIPMYINSRAQGLDGGYGRDFGYTTNLGGVNLGVDYTDEDMYRYGIAAHAGGGTTGSDGDYSFTNNDFEYYGLTAYAGHRSGKYSYYADIHFSTSDNKLMQYNPEGTGNLFTELDAYAISSDLRVDYFHQTEKVDITPHATLRYTYMVMDDYQVRQNGSNILNVKCAGQSYFTIPLGVTLSKMYQRGECKILPWVDLGMVFKMGDLDAKSTAWSEGITPTPLYIETMSPFYLQGEAGFEIKNGNHAYGAAYQIEYSEEFVNQLIKIQYRYQF